MKPLLIAAVVLAAGCRAATDTATTAPPIDYPDLAKVEAIEPGRVYRLSDSGICGTVDDGKIIVTAIVPGSPADGSVKVGDRVTGLQYRGLGDVRRTVAKRIYRLGRDWHWKLYVSVERDSSLGGEGNALLFPLTLPPKPGIVHHLGPTGIYAKIYPDRVVVDRIADGSPADGALRVGDTIVAVGDEAIGPDTFEQWTRQIDAAETTQAGGRLALTVQGGGAAQAGGELAAPAVAPRPRQVTLQLNPLGTYSATAPVDCAKTDALITRAADSLIAHKDYDNLNIALLGLLATGEKKYVDHAGEVIHGAAWAKPDVALDMYASMVSWRYSYTLIVLSEYYLATGDQYVLPAIEKYAVAIAEGQDAAGLWNHRGANPAANFGVPHARLYGYGAINQPSITLWVGMILAQKCGIDHPSVDAAVDKTRRHFRNWVDRGSLPYGNHGYVEHHLTNNGSSGIAAVGYALLGDRHAARYWAAMSAAAWDEILTGHTGPFFNIMWSGLGANVLGPQTAAAFNDKVHWLRTVTRRADGRFHYFIAGGNTFEYGQSSSTGANLLNLSVGRHALYITGKSADRSLWLTGDAARRAVDAGRVRDPSTRGLLAALGSDLPRVRLHAAELLAVADADVKRDVMKLLTAGNRSQRIGAIHAVAHLKIASADDALMAIVENDDEDLWLRVLAVQTLGGFEDARRLAPRMLAVLMRDKPYDARQDLDAALGGTLNRLLAPDPLAHGLDRELLFAGVNKLLVHPRMDGRGAGMGLIRNITLDDLPRVAGPMIEVIKDRDRGYTSYHGDGHRQAGLEILNRLGIEEVIPLTVSTIKEPTGRGGPRTRGRMRLLETFDANARPYIPQIREALGGGADKVIEQIEHSPTKRKMIKLEDALRAAGD